MTAFFETEMRLFLFDIVGTSNTERAAVYDCFFLSENVYDCLEGVGLL